MKNNQSYVDCEKLEVIYYTNDEENISSCMQMKKDLIAIQDNFYTDKNLSISTKPTFRFFLSSPTTADLVQLCYQITSIKSSEDMFYQMQLVLKKNDFHLIYDGSKLLVCSNFLVMFDNKKNLNHFVDNFRGIKSSLIKSLSFLGITLESINTTDYSKLLIPKLGYNQKANKPIVPILNYITYNQYVELTNSRKFSLDEVSVYVDVDKYIRYYLVPNKVK